MGSNNLDCENFETTDFHVELGEDQSIADYFIEAARSLRRKNMNKESLQVDSLEETQINLPLDIRNRKMSYSTLLENGIPENCSLLDVHTLGATKEEMKKVLDMLWFQIMFPTFQQENFTTCKSISPRRRMALHKEALERESVKKNSPQEERVAHINKMRKSIEPKRKKRENYNMLIPCFWQ